MVKDGCGQIAAAWMEKTEGWEIADKLFVSLETVKGHLKNMYRKLQVTGRHGAVSRAKSLGILSRR
ncbi:MAG: LuxR C-terminal-related transcriptional regulator [Syntrophobacteria bacterium]